MLLAEVVGGGTLRLFIDHPDGVTLALCERVTGHAGRLPRAVLRSRSPRPGQDRPLTKPQHFSRFLGRRARVRLREATRAGTRVSPASSSAPPSEDVTIASRRGVVTIPYEQIARSNLVPGD